MLAIQAVQVLVLALIQWHSGCTVARLVSAAPGVALQHARRKGCCCCRRAPKGRETWLPRARVRESSWQNVASSAREGHSVINALSALPKAEGTEMAPVISTPHEQDAVKQKAAAATAIAIAPANGPSVSTASTSSKSAPPPLSPPNL